MSDASVSITRQCEISAMSYLTKPQEWIPSELPLLRWLFPSFTHFILASIAANVGFSYDTSLFFYCLLNSEATELINCVFV